MVGTQKSEAVTSDNLMLLRKWISNVSDVSMRVQLQQGGQPAEERRLHHCAFLPTSLLWFILLCAECVTNG